MAIRFLIASTLIKEYSKTGLLQNTDIRNTYLGSMIVNTWQLIMLGNIQDTTAEATLLI